MTRNGPNSSGIFSLSNSLLQISGSEHSATSLSQTTQHMGQTPSITMFVFERLVRAVIIVSWIFAGVSHCQGGGSYGFPANALNPNASCSVLGNSTASLFGCFLNGKVNSTFQITPGSTTVIPGAGYFAAPFFITSKRVLPSLVCI